MKTVHAVCIWWTYVALAQGVCPHWDNDGPCVCSKTKEGIMVQCIGPAQADRVYSALENVRPPTTGPAQADRVYSALENVRPPTTGPAQADRVYSALESVRPRTTWELQLDSLDLVELPANVRTVSSLRLTNCALGRLLRTTPLLWPHLYEIVFESVRMEHNPWAQLRGARGLKSMKISDFPMRTMGRDFRGLPDSVEYIDLRKTGMTRLDPGCMSHMKNLLYVFIADMPLSEFPRSALPAQLPQLHTFILGNTLIEKLEANFFDGMSSLEVLMLNGNRFSSLDSQLFMPLRSHLTHLLAERNPLQCDCNLLWLKRNFQGKRSIKVLATCYDTPRQEYREVMKLDWEEYCL